MKEIKQQVLANLEFLPDKINFRTTSTQCVMLNSHYFEENQQRAYSLSIELMVTMTKVNDEIIIDEFFIETIHFHYNNGCKPTFNFTKKELTDYIDF